MDWTTVLTALTSSLGISVAGAWWLSRTLIQHKLAEAMESAKAELQREINRDKSLVEGAVKQEVETYLGKAAAQRQYEYDARKRLYTAIGPLRFQLLLACADLANRIEKHGLRELYATNIQNYYGRSTLYRILRPIAIAELIEQQIAVADFSVDATAMDCLRFKKSIVRIFSGEEITCAHPGVNWKMQEQHAYADSIAASANVLIHRAPGAADRILRFDEFKAWIDQNNDAPLAPFPALLQDFRIGVKPILWVRLVAYGHACSNLINTLGHPLGFEAREFPTEVLLAKTLDPHVMANLKKYSDTIAALELLKL